MPLPQEIKPRQNFFEAKPERAEIPEALESLPEETTTTESEEAGPIDKAIGSLQHLMGKPKKTLPAIPQVRDEIMVRVEKIMEENLADAYGALDVAHKQEFKIKGEVTAAAIRELLNKTKVKIKKIFQLILEWLLLLPGVNHFYLEQEAKIKADRILALKNHIRGQM